MVKFRKILFLCVGLSFAGGGLYALCNTILFLKNSVKTSGQVVTLKIRTTSKGVTKYCPVIKFNAQNRMLYHTVYDLNECYSASSSVRVGDTVNILYNKNNPDKIHTSPAYYFWFLFIIFFTAVSVYIAFLSICNLFSRNFDKIKFNSNVIDTKLKEIYVDETSNLDEYHPYIVRTHYQDKIFESEPLPFNPENFIKPDQIIKVYVDKQDSEKYYVDLSFLPKIKSK